MEHELCKDCWCEPVVIEVPASDEKNSEGE